MKYPDLISVTELTTITHTTSLTGTIDPTSNLERSKVYLYSGSKDTVVNPGTYISINNTSQCTIGVMEKLFEYYSHFISSTSNIVTEFDIPSQHAIVYYTVYCIDIYYIFIGNR